jgi:hypothetical protein
MDLVYAASAGQRMAAFSLEMLRVYTFPLNLQLNQPNRTTPENRQSDSPSSDSAHRRVWERVYPIHSLHRLFHPAAVAAL